MKKHVFLTALLMALVCCLLPAFAVADVARITGHLESETLNVGQTTQVVYTLHPEGAASDVIFSTNKPHVVTVDETGKVTAVGRGEAYVYVKVPDGWPRAQMVITVRQQPTAITLSSEAVTVGAGGKATIKATVAPDNANNTRLTWHSNDESVVTVNKNGRITGVAPGQAVVTVSSVEDPSVKAEVQVNCIRLAQSVQFDQKEYSVRVGETVALTATVLPQDTFDPSVTWRSKNEAIATVDENGVVTGLKKGRTSVIATAADGSGKKAVVAVNVLQPVEGVSFKNSRMRVGVGNYSYVSAIFEPSNASNQNAVWTSSDESVAVVTGSGRKVKVSGRQWGECELTLVTEDGGYSATIHVDVGSLPKAVTVQRISIRGGRPRITLKNNSNMNITGVTYIITGLDYYGNPVKLSKKGDGYTLSGGYHLPLAPGETTTHGNFTFYRYLRGHVPLESVSIAITGWTTDTGYYDRNGNLLYDYHIYSGSRRWHTHQTQLFLSKPAVK